MMAMEQYLNKSCKILILINGKCLFYNVKSVTNVSDTHISFLDKYNNSYTYKKEDVKEVNIINKKL